MKRSVCFLQGPPGPFFRILARKLQDQGQNVYKINICLGDRLIWGLSKAYAYRGSFDKWENYIKNFFIKKSITDIVLIGENRPYHKVAIKVAKELNIKVITTDFGYLRPHWITFELNGMSSQSLFPRDPDQIIKLAKEVTPHPPSQKSYKPSFLAESIWEILFSFGSILPFNIFYPRYKRYVRYHPFIMFPCIGLRLFKLKFKKNAMLTKQLELIETDNINYYLFPLQMRLDYQILAYSKYDDMSDAIEEVIKSFATYAPENTKLAIKVHPLDEGVINWKKRISKLEKKYKIEGRVIYFDGGNLMVLIAHSLGVITINSTVGLQSIIRDIPTHTLGDAIYDIKGLTHQAELNKFWDNKPKPNKTLKESFVKLLDSTIQIRGTYYCKSGLEDITNEAAFRIINDKVNKPLK
ncbi:MULTISPECIES: capsule biosynthesis protein [unclassified Francisella]|uniref:capsule biosynthesis protein n=1 Tax=unclassified Francisella TaxID=2610885 RepID=UPI002E37064D|nr:MULTISPECIES: capsular biosynthesis protein [unclassified Francisella]MED7820046.1 capsular biosynthesis protein [Francisella sp. 19S2-4]MED7830866.1 capsular biosynthesis protein [Francisella sp. 19S2-10]